MEGKIVFIGPGVMAEAMCSGLIERGGMEPAAILMSGPEQDRLDELAEKYGVKTTTENREAVDKGKVIVLSIKPQRLGDVLKELSGSIPAEAVVLSIVAGARLGTMSDELQHKAVVRAMPNTPAQVGEGITVWTTTETTTPEQKECAGFILKALGKEIHVDDEEYLDMATALSGTGPAYVFLFMEAMVDAGVHLGFPRRISEELVVQTIKGSVAYYESHPNHMARLKNQVTSPGGTSAEALYYLEKAGFRTALSRAIWAAYERSVQLGEGKKRKTDV
ncbi:MAG: pyrroline-5-carboxylate reductase [Anaerolineales bacterium]|nr:pyrroline-5-carboxylate reductase [Anaerolineales bacterium]